MRKYEFGLLIMVVLTACERNEYPYKTTGRTIFRPDGTIELISSAASVEFEFSGDAVEVMLSNITSQGDYNYIAVESDGDYIGKIKVGSSNPEQFKIAGQSNSTTHRLKIIRATEASNGVILFHGAKAQSIKPVATTRRPKIEFIGNSITAAMGADTLHIPCGGGSKWYDQHNAYFSYASVTGRNLNAEITLSAVSGAGIYRNWNSDGPTVPQQYESAYLTLDSTQQWNFKSWQPDIVTVALGTNDMSPGDGNKPRESFDSSRFISTYVEFMKTLSFHYPEARVILLNSPMMNGGRAEMLMRCLQRVRMLCQEEKIMKFPMVIFEFREMRATGCTGHPLIPEHEQMASQLTTFLSLIIEKKI